MVITALGLYLLFCSGFLLGRLYNRRCCSDTEARLDAMLNTIHELQKALGVKK